MIINSKAKEKNKMIKERERKRDKIFSRQT